MRRQDESFNARLRQMRRDIEDVNTACWHHKVSKTCSVEKPDELRTCHLDEVDGYAAHTEQTISFAANEFVPASRAAGAVKQRRRQKPRLQLELPTDNREASSRCGSESPVDSTEATLFTPKRASVDIFFNPAISKQVSEPSATTAPRSADAVNLLSSGTDQKNSQRRGSLGAWLLKKLQHS